MHTKGKASEDLREKLNLDTCIYFGNDLNDVSMFSNALDDNDFIVIASNEKEQITDMLVEYLQNECKIKGINWENAKLLVLEDRNVNSFLDRMCKLLTRLSYGTNEKQDDIRQKYKVSVKIKNKETKIREKEANKRRGRKVISHR